MKEYVVCSSCIKKVTAKEWSWSDVKQQFYVYLWLPTFLMFSHTWWKNVFLLPRKYWFVRSLLFNKSVWQGWMSWWVEKQEAVVLASGSRARSCTWDLCVRSSSGPWDSSLWLEVTVRSLNRHRVRGSWCWQHVLLQVIVGNDWKIHGIFKEEKTISLLSFWMFFGDFFFLGVLHVFKLSSSFRENGFLK